MSDLIYWFYIIWSCFCNCFSSCTELYAFANFDDISSDLRFKLKTQGYFKIHTLAGKADIRFKHYNVSYLFFTEVDSFLYPQKQFILGEGYIGVTVSFG